MFRFLKRNDSEVITPEVVDVPVMTIQSNIAMALALCMEEYLRSVSKTSVDIPNRDTLVREYNTLVDAGLGSSKNARLLQAKISEYNQIALDAMRAKNLFSFVKRAREVFGESTLLVGSKQVVGPDIEGTLRLSSIVNKNPGLPADVKGFSYPNIVSFDAVKIGRNELFVACPPGQLNNPEVTITKKAVDPIVYQPCAYGILIHSMWGEESEDKVFEEYKRINNLML